MRRLKRICSSRHVRAALGAVICAVSAARCDGPTHPSPPPPPVNTAPAVKSVTPSRTQVEAGQEVEVTVIAEDAETPADSLQYAWQADAGTFSGQGKTVTWKSPTGGPAPQDYALKVTVTDAGGLTATGTSAAIRLNDADRELRQLVNTFLADFSDSTTSPEFCVRNFTDACRGKAEELSDITRNRQYYTILRATYSIAGVYLNSGTFICTYPGGNDACALVVTPVHWVSIYKPDGSLEDAIGDSWITGVYQEQQRQWMLCDSRFFGPSTLGPSMSRFLR